MQLSAVAGAMLGISLIAGHSIWAQEPVVQSRFNLSKHHAKRDASTLMSGGNNNEGEAHGTIKPPKGSTFTDIPVGNGGETIAAYWTKNPNEDKAKQAFIFIHGKLRDGDNYWTIMNDALDSAVKANYPGADEDSIVVAPEFFSTKYNSGQYSKSDLAWPDVNAWQAGDPANHPSGTKLTSFDALDALVDEFSNSTRYPKMNNITVAGHGGGGQLISRYAAVAKDPPSNVHVRYVHGDPSSCAYFTTDRPSISGETLPSKSSCPEYNTWRYGFDNFTGTSDGLKSPQDYFKQYITRDVVSIVGYQDVDASGDTYCMAEMQGGTKRRDRNLIWWRYVNTLARTSEDLTGFPGSYDSLPDWSNISSNYISTRLIVVENADHNPEEVFSSDEGRASLFKDSNLPTGWRPDGWTAVPSQAPPNRGATNSSSQTKGSSATTGSSSSSSQTTGTSDASTLAGSSLVSLFLLCTLALFLVF